MLNLYYTFIAKGVQQFATYRTNIFSGVVTALFILGARYALWWALFSTGNAGDATLAQTMTYFVIMDILLAWTNSRLGDRIGMDIRSGDIAQKLILPCTYHFQLLTNFHTSAVIRTFTHSIPVLIAAAIFIGILPPVSAGAFFVFLLAAVLGGIIYILVDLIISYTAFWLVDYWYTSWYRGALFMLFGGTQLPLWFYPEWLRTVSGFLPFQFSIFVPLEIYLGRMYGADAAWALGLQLFWILILFGIERFVWSRVRYKIVVQGG